MTVAPLTTVLIPAFDSANFIIRTLQSVALQKVAEIRAIVSVDSLDGCTFDVCQSFARQDKRFQVVQQMSNLGWVRNCNYLQSQVQTPYSMILAHDDFIAPDFIGKLQAAICNDPDVVLAFSDLVYTDQYGRSELWQYKELDNMPNNFSQAMLLLQGWGRWWIPYRGIFRNSVARQIGGLRQNASGEHGAELPWLFHLALHGRLVRIPEVLYFKQGSPSTLSSRWKLKHDKSPHKHSLDLLGSVMKEIWISDLDTDKKLAFAQVLMPALLRASTASGGSEQATSKKLKDVTGALALFE